MAELEAKGFIVNVRRGERGARASSSRCIVDLGGPRGVAKAIELYEISERLAKLEAAAAKEAQQ